MDKSVCGMTLFLTPANTLTQTHTGKIESEQHWVLFNLAQVPACMLTIVLLPLSRAGKEKRNSSFPSEQSSVSDSGRHGIICSPDNPLFIKKPNLRQFTISEVWFKEGKLSSSRVK